MSQTFQEVLTYSILSAEEAYDYVVRRWGNVRFAQSTVYDWLWSEDFNSLCSFLSELEKGQIRVLVMQRFGVKPWPWYANQYPSHFY